MHRTAGSFQGQIPAAWMKNLTMADLGITTRYTPTDAPVTLNSTSTVHKAAEDAPAGRGAGAVWTRTRLVGPEGHRSSGPSGSQRRRLASLERSQRPEESWHVRVTTDRSVAQGSQAVPGRPQARKLFPRQHPSPLSRWGAGCKVRGAAGTAGAGGADRRGYLSRCAPHRSWCRCVLAASCPGDPGCRSSGCSCSLSLQRGRGRDGGLRSWKPQRGHCGRERAPRACGEERWGPQGTRQRARVSQ